MTLQVIGAGLGRTGTMTLKIALERLGFGPCHHMTEVLANPDQLDFWNRAAEGEQVDWNTVYSGYSATVDWPGASFVRQLADAYPRAKVVLSTRDPEDWYRSMRATILTSMEQMGLAGTEVASDHPMRFGQLLIAHQLFGSDFSETNVKAAFERHNQQVIRGISANRLLIFDPAEGWAPLCDFLEVDTPGEPFPRTNNRSDFWVHADQAKHISAERSSAA